MANETRIYHVQTGQHGVRLDRFLLEQLQDSRLQAGFSRTSLQKLIRDGAVTLNGKVAKQPSYSLRRGDCLCFAVPQLRSVGTLQPEAIPLDISHEDSHLIVINKPAGMLVHPASGVNTGTLVNALLAHSTSLSSIGGAERPGIVHRLDKDTSGLLVVAKTDDVHRELSRQLEARAMTRHYVAVVCGTPANAFGTIDAQIARSRRDRRRMTTVETDGRRAVTHYEVAESYDKFAFLRLRLETGRLHQIRVHLQHIGHPIAGDAVYGGAKRAMHDTAASLVKQALSQLKRQALHAHTLGFVHPVTRERLSFSAPMPADMQRLVDALFDTKCEMR